MTAGHARSDHALAPPSVTRTLASTGVPLPSSLRADMETSFGRTLAGVRLHTGPSAAESAADVNALAYTVGEHMVFASGQFAPDSTNGRRLLIHELAHVVQGPEALRPGPITIAPANHPLESEADHASETMSGASTPRFTSGAAGATLRRQPNPWRWYVGGRQAGQKLKPVADVLDVVLLKHPTGAVEAYLKGVYEGIKTVDEAKAEQFRDKMVVSSVITAAFPPLFYSGAGVGIVDDVIEMKKAAEKLIDDWQEVIEATWEILKSMFTPDGAELARVMGVETGKEFASKVEELSSQNVASFTYNLGRWVGPTIVYTVLSFLGVPELAAVAAFQKVAGALRKFLSKFPKLAALANKARKAAPDVDAPKKRPDLPERKPTPAKPDLPEGEPPKPTTTPSKSGTLAPETKAEPGRPGKDLSPDELKDLNSIGPVSPDTLPLLRSKPALRKALAANKRAARILKKCNTPCFPDMDPALVGRLEERLRAMERAKIPYDPDHLRNRLYAARKGGRLQDEIDKMGAELAAKLGPEGRKTSPPPAKAPAKLPLKPKGAETPETPTAAPKDKPGKGGKPPTGPGKWLDTIGAGRNMSREAAAYQTKIGGMPATKGYFVNAVEFDGFKGGKLLDAKFFEKGGRFVTAERYRIFYKGQSLYHQAVSQVRVARGTPIEWHVPSKEAKDLLDQMMKANDLPIEVVVTPP